MPLLPALPDPRHRFTLTVLLWTMIACLGAVLLWNRIGHESMGFDEAYSLAAVGWDIPVMIPMIGKDSHPPLYFIMLNLFTSVFGHTPEAARSLSALGALAMASLGFFPLRKWAGDRQGMLYSLLCLASPMTVIMGQDARMYTWGAFFVTAAFLCAWDVRQKIRQKAPHIWPSWFALSLFSLAAAYTHYYALMAALFVWVFLLGWLLRQIVRKGMSFRQLIPFGLWATLCIAAWLPWLGFVMMQAGRISRNYWIGSPDAGTVIDVLCMPWNFKYGMAFPSFLLMPVAWGIILKQASRPCMEWIRAKLDHKSPDQKNRDALGQMAFGLGAGGVFLLVLATATIISLSFKPILVQRYMVCGLGLMMLALSWGLERMLCQRGKDRKAGALLALYLVCGSAALGEVYGNRCSGGMFEAQEFLKPLMGADDVFIHASEHTLGTFAWYAPHNRHYLYLPKKFVPYSNYEVFLKNSRWGDDLAQYLEDGPGSGKQHQTLWFAFVEFQDYFEPFRQILDSPNWTFATSLQTFAVGSSWYNPCLIGFRRLKPGEHKLTAEEFLAQKESPIP